MDPKNRATDSHSDFDGLGRRRHASQHGPDEGAVALSTDPGVKVIRYGDEVESPLLGEDRHVDQSARAVLLGRECKSKFHRIPPKFPGAESATGTPRPGRSNGLSAAVHRLAPVRGHQR